MKKSIHVHILGREYTLRVEESAESSMRSLAVMLDERMRAFRESHPTQPEVTAAVITALSLAERVYTLEQMLDKQGDSLDDELGPLLDQLEEALETES